MPKYDRLVISGKQREHIDASALARVILLLARRWLRRSMSEEQQAKGEDSSS